MNIPMKRRTFLKTTLSGLTLGAGLTTGCKPTKTLNSRFVTIWLNISAQNEINVVIVKNEMGQGISTALPMVVAEELEADWGKIGFQFLPELDEYILSKEGDYGTADSMTIRIGYEPMRLAGAAAKEMLIKACAQKWRVSPSTLTAVNSQISHPAFGSISYGELAEAANRLPVPKHPKLKDPRDFKIIGRPLHRLDSRAHIEGKSQFGIDCKLPEMLYAAVRQAPVGGGDVINFDKLSVNGTKLEAIVPVRHGVAAVAKSWWEAQRALDNLDIQFSRPEDMKNLNSKEFSHDLDKALLEPTIKGEYKGDALAAWQKAAKTVKSAFEVPFLDHAAIEPLSCTAYATETSCEIWVPTQWTARVLWTARDRTGLPFSAIKIHPMFMGGGFGRKYEVDYVNHAILASKAVGKPVKVIWSREEDIQHGFYRSPAKAELSGALDRDGNIVSWIATLAAPRMGKNWFELSLAGFTQMPYSIPNIKIDWAEYKPKIRNGYMRSVNMSHNYFFVESFIDELAHAAGQDPLAFRLRHVQHNVRAKAVLEKVAEMAGWGQSHRPGKAFGLCLFDSMANDGKRTVIATVAEVAIATDGAVQVPKICCAVDCGRVINPDIAKAQIEGGAIFGLTAALYGKITINEGRVEQSNFHDYPLVDMISSPQIEVAITDSDQPPSGVGEYSVPGIAPAVTNAIFLITGKRITDLPINRQLLT
jgi:isoquinoline 1-oxidoreductase subunit beta